MLLPDVFGNRLSALKMLITKVLHKLASRPLIYDQIQRLVGRDQVLERISKQMSMAIPPNYVVDIGGGTGSMRSLLPVDCKYVCLDIEMPKLRGFRAKVPNGLAVLSDAAKAPIVDACADAVICTAVSHHLADEALDGVLREIVRMLRIGGMVYFLDATFEPSRIAGRLIWALDRGSYPRSSEALRSALEARFDIVHWEQFAIYHEYIFAVGMRS
jgi:ubiquinone/menaquinone biosynthesis C-methylase UbiE